MRLALALLAMALSSMAHARDDGRWAQAEPRIKQWMNGLTNGRGQGCCSDADGDKVNDLDWRATAEGYEVAIGGKWLKVPAHAVLTGPNLIGRAMVWPVPDGKGSVTIRCFLPGSMG